jgi:hypothetical protein
VADPQELQKAFFISQVGDRASPERRRADEVFDHIITPVARDFQLVVTRADRDPTPGQITSEMVRSLLESAVVFADLTGRNPNVYYELGVAHSFRLPVVILVDTASSLSFDTQNERVIPIGDTGVIGVSQAEEAKHQLRSVLKVVLEKDYQPESLLTAVATSQSLDALAPSNPLASELASVKESVEANNSLVRKALHGHSVMADPDFRAAQTFIEDMAWRNVVNEEDLSALMTQHTTPPFDEWVNKFTSRLPKPKQPIFNDEPPF